MIALLAFLLQQTPPPQDPKWDRMDYGPFLTTALSMPWPKGAVTPKGVVVKTGAGAACFDTDLLRYAGGWSGGFLTLMGPPFEGSRSPDEKTRPLPKAPMIFATKNTPGWGRGEDFKDPRPEPYGPLPAGWAKYKGLYVQGDRVVFSYTVGTCDVLDMPGLETVQGKAVFSRTLRLSPSKDPLTLLCYELREDPTIGIDAIGLPEGAEYKVPEPLRAVLKLPPHDKDLVFKLFIGPDGATATAAAKDGRIEDPSLFTKGGPTRYPEPVETKGALGKTGAAYEVDTITSPEDNPWHSWLRFSGLDFFSDGRAALCTWSGDVWIVSGIDDSLSRLRWKRFATGLFQPCGLKIVDDVVYVAARDQITRLRDLNGDGEVDYYENFNNDCTEKGNYHEFAMDLHTDAEGNFYYCKGALGANFPGGPIAAHHGCMLKVSKDGKKLEVYATGIRAGAGSGVGPNGEVTASDNDGHWGPASRLNLLKPGGYYGDPHTAHRSELPKDYDPPLCWIHRSVDNSSGGQVWVTGDRWGPFQGRMLHLSYGTCSLFLVLQETVQGQPQGGIVRFPLTFASGILRSRFGPKDGQLYVAGLRGWTTTANRDGCFQRVRYTGKSFCSVQELHVTKTGVELTFTAPVDPALAADPDNYDALWWNYAYTEKYGSPDFSVADPKKQGRDAVEIKSVKVSPDGKKLSLEIPTIRPVMQLLLRIRIKGADGSAVNQDVWSTIHKVP